MGEATSSPFGFWHKYEENREDGLSVCTVCRGGEGALPSMCPGVPMTADQIDAVYAGKIDFDVGAASRLPHWWTKTE